MPHQPLNSSYIRYSETRDLPLESVLAFYRANHWSSVKKPELLYKGLLASHSLVSGWHDRKLIGLGNAISDGYLVVYYPHCSCFQIIRDVGSAQNSCGGSWPTTRDFTSTCSSQTGVLSTFTASVDLSVQARPSQCGFMQVMTTDEIITPLLEPI